MIVHFKDVTSTVFPKGLCGASVRVYGPDMTTKYKPPSNGVTTDLQQTTCKTCRSKLEGKR